MEQPENEDKLDFNDISFDDIVSVDNNLSDTLTLSDDNADSIKASGSDAEELGVEDESVKVNNELEEDAAKTINDDIIEPTDKDDVDKEEIDAALEEQDKEVSSDKGEESTVVKEVLDSLGFEGEYDYEDTPEGLKTLTLDVANKLAEEQLDNILETFPLVQRHLEYVMNGGESENFMKANDPQSDYGKLELTEKDIPMQRVVLRNYFKAKGHEDAMVNELLEDYEDSGKLFAKAELAKTQLSEAQTKQRLSMLEEQKKSNIKSQEEEKQFWSGIQKTIQETDELAGISIPNREKNKFFKYISAPVNKQGQTQSMVDKSNNTNEQKLLMDYLMFKGLNLKEIIATKAKSQNTRSLKDRIQKSSKATLKSANKKTKAKTNLDLNDLDFGSLMS
tara:strand:- start:18429 stop:19604 length:1176 start_codon:yes stop_codon:yes gene_type:complete